MRFFLEIFGCKFNQAEGELIRKILKEKGYEEASEKEADFIVLVSCGVVEKTERKIIKRIEELKKRKKKIIVAGCLPLISPQIVKKLADGAVGPTNLLELPTVLKRVSQGKKIFFLKPRPIDKAKLRCFALPQNTCVAIIPIAEGCLSNCAYCATKLAKGKLRSFEEKEILENVKLALKEGAKEIQLTSQDLAIYGLDKRKWNLPSLLKKIAQIKGDFRIRLGMMNPWGAKRIFSSLLKIIEDEKFYKFLHLPLQSGDNEVLKSMRRQYTVEDFLELVKKFKSKFPNSVLATDVIVGYPTENEKAFNNTFKVIKKIKPDILHLFRYSKRAGTESSQLQDLPERIKKERSRILTRLWLKIVKEKNKKFFGKKFTVLITEKREKNFLARLNSYKAVILKEGKVGDFLKIKIIATRPNYLIGKILK